MTSPNHIITHNSHRRRKVLNISGVVGVVGWQVSEYWGGGGGGGGGGG